MRELRLAEDATFSQLIGRVYECALDPAAWAGLSISIAESFHSNSCVVKVHDADGAVRLVEATQNLAVPGRLQPLADYWHPRDLWVERSVAHGFSEIVTSDMLVTADECRRSGFYHEWLSELDIHHMIGAVFRAPGGGISVLGVHRPEPSGCYERADRERMAALLPHLERSVALAARIGALEQDKRWSVRAIDGVDAGMLLLDRHCRIVRMNKVAEEIIASNTALRATGGRFWLADPGDNSRLALLVAGSIAIARGEAAPPAGALLVERPGRLALTITAAPLDSRADVLNGDRWHALVFLRDPEYPPVRTEQLRALFGLTRREAEIAAELATGRSLTAIAALQQLGRETVRSHLKQILAKTGTSRQAELVALISRSVAFLNT